MSDKYLIIGLGNPGDEYAHTRHNAGWLMVDAILNMEGAIICKTDVFMNSSGRFVKDQMNKHKIPSCRLVVVHDDWDFPVGEFRVQFGRGHNQHKGVASIINAIGTKEFWRVRIGIGTPGTNIAHSDYVLGNMSKKEEAVITNLSFDVMRELKRHLDQD